MGGNGMEDGVEGLAALFERDMQRLLATIERPTFQRFLDATAAGLHATGADVFADPAAFAGKRLRARFTPPGEDRLSAPIGDGPLKEHLVSVLWVLRDDYVMSLQRRPKLTEVLEALTRCLRAHPERFLADGHGPALVEIVAEPA